MNQKQWQKVNNIVDTALELDKEERYTYIEEQCEGDQLLKTHVTELLESIEASDTEGFLEGPEAYPQHLAADFSKKEVAESASSLIGKTIGPYKITELIGHGGMGSVFLAERADNAYEGKIAFKILRQGMDTPSNIARFKRERNILAQLDHPNIARLLDGGLTDDGLPYLVMEYVDGIPLYDYCDKHRLSIDERLQLFKSIGKAVQHAHKNAVIHRDLKPSNILVTEEGVIKVLDFGIAKLLKPENSEATIFQTRTGARMLTLGYAAPEQVNSQPITTATDTYALGILLYELLASIHPFDLDDKTITEIEETIREQTPDHPSIKFNRLPDNDQNEIAQKRGISASAVVKKLEGDLDAIIMKALRKEPEARYSSAEQLLEDLRRREHKQPIIAREDTLRYKFSKFIRRRKASLAVVSGFLLLIAGFAGFYTWQITEERNRALQEEEKAQQTLEYLVEIFQQADPNVSGDQDLTAQQILEEGTAYINNEIHNQPEIKAPLLNAVGTIYQHLGKFDKAESSLHRALTINQKIYTNDHINLANSLYDWAGYNMKIGDSDTAKKYFSKSSAMYKRLGNKNKYAASIGELGWLAYETGDYKTGDSLLSKALDINRSLHGPESKAVAWDYQYLGWIKNGQGQYNRADSLFRQALAIRRAELGNDHRLTAQTLQSLGRTLYNKGDYPGSQQNVSEALKIQRQIFNDANHPDIASSLNILGLIHMRQKKYELAERYFKDALEMRITLYGSNHPSVLNSKNDLATIYFHRQKYLKAAEVFKQVADANKEVRGPSHPEVATSLNNRALALQNAGQNNKALESYREALEIAYRNYSGDHPKFIHFRKNAALLYEELTQYEEASELWLQNFQVYQKENGLNHSNTKEALNHLINCYQKLNDTEKVEKYQTLLDN